MYQGEFIEKVLDGALSEPDIRAFIISQTKKDLQGLIDYIRDKQSGYLVQHFFNENPHWASDFQKLEAVVTIINERGDGFRSMPSFLSGRGVKAFNDSISMGLIDKETYSWAKSKAALSNWVFDICTVGGVTTKLAEGRKTDWKSFEDYFGVKHLAIANYKSDKNHSCKDYDVVKRKLFPELR